MGNWGEMMWSAVEAEFSDLTNVEQVIPLFVRLLLAVILGGLLGIQRERAHKSAGLRTHMLVTLGAALFVMIGEMAGLTSADVSRVIQGIVTGIGFLGAGAILKLSDEKRVKGMTTAAGIWLATAIGTGVGLGRYWLAILGTILALLILSILGWAELRVEKKEDQERKTT